MRGGGPDGACHLCEQAIILLEVCNEVQMPSGRIVYAHADCVSLADGPRAALLAEVRRLRKAVGT